VRAERVYLVAGLWLSSPAWAQSAFDLLTRGNQKFAAKEYDGAADLYRRAQSAKNPPTAAAALYNEGCALLEQGKADDAAARFREADAGAGHDTDLSARARFNLGQSLFRQAGAAQEKQAERALELLRQSAGAFRSVLEVNPGDADAARNVEIARRLMKQVEDKQRQEQQKQEQAQQQKGQEGDQKKPDQQSGEQQKQDQQEVQKQADQLRDLAKRQQQAAGDSAQAQQSGADKQQTDDLAKKQRELKNDTAKAQEQSKDSAASEQLSQAQQEQQKAAEELQKQNPGAAREHQEQAAKLLDRAAKQAEEKAREQGHQNGQDQQKQQQAKAEQQNKDGSKGEAAQQAKAEPKREQNYDKTATALLDRERQLRQQRQPVVRAARGSGPPVAKDW
jgi:hypothetical protein